MEEFSKLVELMATLRGEAGCPWDKKQTEKSFRTFLLEEVYELIDAIEADNHGMMKEELGDLLFHIVFISQICSEKGFFDIREVVASTYHKMRNRHPHIFSPDAADEPKDSAGRASGILSIEHREGERETGVPASRVVALPPEGATGYPLAGVPIIEMRWEDLKRSEKENYSPLAGVPRILPALLRAYVVSKRASKVGFDWKEVGDVYEKLEEELKELREAEKSGDRQQLEEEVGDLLFTAANISRLYGIDPEAALRGTIDKFIRRFSYIESHVDVQKSDMNSMEVLWNEVKNREKEGG